MVGTFFFDGKPLGGDTYCTGSVVHTAAKDIVLTAGHCGIGLSKATHRVFVPQYSSGKSAAQQPFGVFPVLQVYTDPRYTANTKSAASDLDLSFAQVDANSRGKVEDVTGALTFTPTSGYNHKVTVIGYPGSGSVNPGHLPIRCPVTTSQLPGFRQLRMTCKGFYGGVSGGPWIEGYDSATGRGKVIGNTGGYNGGGNDADDDWVSYAPVYGKDAQNLFQHASVHQQLGKNPPYSGTTDPWLPGSASTWKKAALMTSGDFRGTGHSDLIVVWTDGEVTLYPGDGHGGYGTERRLMAPNSTWNERQDHHCGRLHRVRSVRPPGALDGRRGHPVRRRRLQGAEPGRHPDDQTQRHLEERHPDQRRPLRQHAVRHRSDRALGRRRAHPVHQRRRRHLRAAAPAQGPQRHLEERHPAHQW
nr:trypsin-like serine protease [Streptomyces sp. SID4946]